MIKNQKVTVSRRISTKPSADGKHLIYIRIFVDARKSELSIKHKIYKEQWDHIKKKVRPTCNSADHINSYMNTIESKVYEAYYQMRGEGQTITPVMLKNKILGKDPQSLSKEKTLLYAFETHNKQMEKEVEIGKFVKKTWERYKVTKRKVERFLRKRGVQDIKLKELKLGFIKDFELFLMTEYDLQSNTAHKHIRNVKKVINMALGLDWIQVDPFRQFKCQYKNPTREVLTSEEIQALLDKDFGNKRLEQVRDVFIFCCYTGFSYQDLYNFKHDALTRGIDGEYWLSTNRHKTGVKESLPLLPVALDIVMKYQNDEKCIKRNKLLPVLTNQCYNSYLKEIGNICKINKKITSHIARHTFATTITLANGVPIETVSTMLGHNSIRTTQIYAKVVEQKVSEDMKVLRDRLFNIYEVDNQKSLG
jgi:site-specific recombinase XerD